MDYALKNTELFEKGHSLAEKQIFVHEYPWQVLPHIKDIILEIGKSLPADRYDNPLEGVWIAKSAKVSPSASVSGPCIIGEDTEVRQCAFIRGSALVGDGLPCTDDMTAEQVQGQYELETGNVIVSRFEGINPDHTPGVLVKNHGPFTWGKNPADAVYNAKVLEQCAQMAYISLTLNPQTGMNPLLVEKHYSRKHGPNAYYGQKKK